MCLFKGILINASVLHIFSIIWKIIDTFVLHFSETFEEFCLLKARSLFFIHCFWISWTIPTVRVHIVHIYAVACTIDTHKVGHDIYGHREDNGAVVLSSDAVKSLEITQLKKRFFVC